MDGFGLLCGHLLGDYIFQNDWMASNKTIFGRKVRCNEKNEFDDVTYVCESLDDDPERTKHFPGSVVYERMRGEAVEEERDKTATGHLSCTVHCLLYTLAVWACSFWWMPWWGLLVCFVLHWPVDRFRLAKWWMVNVSGQEAFATGALAPWSVIAVDNTFHLLTLLAIGLVAGL